MPITVTPTYSYYTDPVIPPEGNKSRLSKTFGIHLWQIFTAITLILTVSSGLIYFNSIVPQNKNREFIDITKAKTTFYNQQEYIKTFYSENYNQNLVGVQLVQSCYSDINNINPNIDTIAEDLDELYEQRRYLNVLNEEFNSQNYDSRYSRLLQEYVISLQNYLTEVVLLFEKQAVYAEETLKIQKEAAAICSADLETASDTIAKFTELTSIYPVSSLENMKDWLDNAVAWKDTTQELINYINSEDYNPEGAEELVSAFREQYIGIFSTAFDYETYGSEIEIFYAQAMESLQQVESYEKDYISNNKLVEGNTIFVADKQEE